MVYSNLPFLSNSVFFPGEKTTIKKSSGTSTNFHLAVEKGCVQQFVDIKYLTWSILGALNNGILKLIDA